MKLVRITDVIKAIVICVSMTCATQAGAVGAPTFFVVADPIAPEPVAPEQSNQYRLGEYEQPRQPGTFPKDFWQRPRRLHLYNVHTREEINEVYWKDGQLIPEVYWKYCHILRDHRKNLMVAMDPRLLDIMYGIQQYYQAWNYRKPINILSGYRTKETNDGLRANNREAPAKNSQHMYGRAVDIAIDGVNQKQVGDLARYFYPGGVGYYPASKFSHIDTWKLRTWTGATKR